jgi:hypothetical protein
LQTLVGLEGQHPSQGLKKNQQPKTPEKRGISLST